jgi:hypothetical protein
MLLNRAQSFVAPVPTAYSLSNPPPAPVNPLSNSTLQGDRMGYCTPPLGSPAGAGGGDFSMVPSRLICPQPLAMDSLAWYGDDVQNMN